MSKILTLASVTSERARQVWGGAPGAPPCYLGSGANFCSKIMFPQRLAHTQLELYPGIKKCARNGTKISFLYANQAFKWAQKEKNSMSHFWENAILGFLPYKALTRIRGKITKIESILFVSIILSFSKNLWCLNLPLLVVRYLKRDCIKRDPSSEIV